MQPWPRVVLIAAFFVAVAAGMYCVTFIYQPVIEPLLEVAPPFVIAIILAFLLGPLVDNIQRLKLPFVGTSASRDFAVAIVGIMFLVSFVLAGFMLLPKMADQASQLVKNYDTYVSQIQTRVNDILQAHTVLLHRLHTPTNAKDLFIKYSGELAGIARGTASVIAGLLVGFLSKILWFIIIPLVTLWFLRDLDYIKVKVVHFTPEKHRDRLITLSTAIGGVFGKYVRGMITVAIFFSLVTMVVLSAAGLNYGLIIGAVSGLFYMVPYVGVAIIATITGLAGLVQPHHGTEYAIVLACYLFFQSFVLFDLVVTPKVVGGSVGVHPVLTLFSLALGAKMFGVVGMIAAVPVAASLQLAIGQVYPKMLERVGRPPKKEKPPKKPPREPRRRRREG